MNLAKADTLRVPGASLYYEVRGSGPILLMIAGGAGDASSYNGLMDTLTPRFTVVTYDRRGFARSPMDDPNQTFELETHSEDIHHLLAALTHKPACVMGSSIGALIGLDLTLRHSEQVRTLVAHEPPVKEVVPEGAANLIQPNPEQSSDDVIRQFAASIGIKHSEKAINTVAVKDAERAEKNQASFLKHDAGAVARYWLDVEALKRVPSQIIVAGGRDGRQYFPYQCAVALADRLGSALAEFPGNHAGFVDYPQAFAERLGAVLSN